MSSDKANILPWVEASTLLGGIMVAAIATMAISLYRIDSIEDKVDDLVVAVAKIDVIRNDISNLKEHDKQTQLIFTKFADSVDRLTVAVAKLEGQSYGKKRGN